MEMQTTTEPAQPRCIDLVAAARMVREALKRSFPDCKFSVRCERASMSRSIDIHWTNGPTVAQVDEVVGVYAGERFDGMNDMRYGVEHWLLPDGSVRVARTRGTVGYGGVHPAERHDSPHPQAELVRFGVDFVMTSRKIDPHTWAAKVQDIMRVMGTQYPSQYGRYNGEFEDANTHAHRFFYVCALPSAASAGEQAAA